MPISQHLFCAAPATSQVPTPTPDDNASHTSPLQATLAASECVHQHRSQSGMLIHNRRGLPAAATLPDDHSQSRRDDVSSCV